MTHLSMLRERNLNMRNLLFLVLAGLVALAGCGGDSGTTLPPVSHPMLVFTQQPQGSTAGVSLADVQVSLTDGTGAVIDDSGTVTLALAASPTGATFAPVELQLEHGVATFKGVTLTKAGGYVFEARRGTLKQLSFGFDITAAGPGKLVVASEPVEEPVAGESITPAVTVAVQDAFGNALPDVGGEVTVSLEGEGGTLDGTLTALVSHGVATFTDLSVDKVGDYTLAFHYGATVVAQSRRVHVKPGAPAGLAFELQPSGAVAGVSFAPGISVAIVDKKGNMVPGAVGDVTVALADNPGNAELGGTLTVPAAEGVAVFPDLSVQRAAAGYTLQAISGTLAPATSDAFSVTAAAAAKLAFAEQPAGATTAGEALGATVYVLDAFDNLTESTDAVTVALDANPGKTSLSGTTTVAAVAGVATFSGLTLTRAEAGYTLAASSGALEGATSTDFAILPAAPVSLSFAAQPITVTAGSPFGQVVQVAIQDAFGNTVTASTRQVSVALKANPGGATLLGTQAVDAVAGVADFDTLSLEKAAQRYTLRAFATGTPALAEVESDAFDVVPDRAAGLVFSQQPSDVAAGKAMAPAVRVRVVDAYGNPSPTRMGITLSLADNPGEASVLGQSQADSVGGEAVFTVGLDMVGEGYTFRASTLQLPSVTSDPFNVTPGKPAVLSFLSEPADATAGDTLSETQVESRDAFGNLNTDSNLSITLSLNVNPTGASLEGTTSVALVDGVAIFDAVKLTRAGQGYKVMATAAGVSRGAVGANSFDITPGPEAQLAFVKQPGSGLAGLALAPSPVVAVQDAYGNTVPGFSGPVAVALGTNPQGATLGGGATVNAKAGVAGFYVNVDKAGTGYTLTASADGLTGAESSAFDVGANTHKLVYTDPAGGKVALVRNAASTDIHVVLDVVAKEALTGYGVGFNLPVDGTRARLNATGLVPGTVLNPGANPMAAAAALPESGPLAGVLTSALSQKASGEGAVDTDTAIAAGAVLYTLNVDLSSAATPGVVFDGAALPKAFNGTLRDRQGNEVVGRNGFAIGRLEVQ